MNVGATIRLHRRLAEVSQQTLAARLRCSQVQVSKFERGLAKPTATQLHTIERVLGVSFSDVEERDQ